MVRVNEVVRQGVTLELEAFGRKDNPVVLLIAGAGAPMDFWPIDFCQRLAGNKFYVIRYSNRDTGLSTHFDEFYSIHELLLDLMALVRNKSSAPVHLIGHSMGGYLAQLAMCNFPNVVASVTSISAGSTVSQEVTAKLGMSAISEQTWEVLMKNQPVGDYEQDLAGWLQSWRFLNGQAPFSEEAATRYTQSLYRGDPRNAQMAENHIHAMSTVPTELIGQLKSSTCPLQVIHGTDDPLVPIDHGEATANLVTGSKFDYLPNAGHMFFDGPTWDMIGLLVAEHISNA